MLCKSQMPCEGAQFGMNKGPGALTELEEISMCKAGLFGCEKPGVPGSRAVSFTTD